MVTMYALLLFVLVILQIVLAVFAFMYTKELANAARSGFETLWTDRSSPQSAKAIDGIQQGLQCCGSSGPLSWGLSVPNSCCAGNVSCNTLSAFSNGCSDVLFDLVYGSGLLIAW